MLGVVRFRVTPHDARTYRELDDALGLSVMAGEMLADARTGKNGRHALVGLLRQSVFGRLAGYEDVNDAERLRHDPAMRWIVGGKAAQGHPARFGVYHASNLLCAVTWAVKPWSVVRRSTRKSTAPA
jgi:hypothetical protein